MTHACIAPLCGEGGGMEEGGGIEEEPPPRVSELLEGLVGGWGAGTCGKYGRRIKSAVRTSVVWECKQGAHEPQTRLRYSWRRQTCTRSARVHGLSHTTTTASIARFYTNTPTRLPPTQPPPFRYSHHPQPPHAPTPPLLAGACLCRHYRRLPELTPPHPPTPTPPISLHH